MFCPNVLPNVLPKCSADRADGATTEGTILAAAPKASMPPQVASTISTLSRVSGCWEGPKKPTWKAWKNGGTILMS